MPEPPADWTDAKHLADIEAEKCVHDTGEILPPADTDWYNFTLLAAFDVEIEVRGDENRDAEMWLYDSSGVPTAHIVYDDNSGEGLLPKITAVSLEPDTYYFKLESKDDESLQYSIVLKAATPGQLGDSYEDDDTYDKARLITDGEMQTHSFYPAGDEDWVKFTLGSTADITIETSGPGDADTEMWLYGGGSGWVKYDCDVLPEEAGWTKIWDYGTWIEDGIWKGYENDLEGIYKRGRYNKSWSASSSTGTTVETRANVNHIDGESAPDFAVNMYNGQYGISMRIGDSSVWLDDGGWPYPYSCAIPEGFNIFRCTLQDNTVSLYVNGEHKT